MSEGMSGGPIGYKRTRDGRLVGPDGKEPKEFGWDELTKGRGMSDSEMKLTTPHLLLEECDAKIERLERENHRLRDRLAKAEAVCREAESSCCVDHWKPLVDRLDEWRKAKGESET